MAARWETRRSGGGACTVVTGAILLLSGWGCTGDVPVVEVHGRLDQDIRRLTYNPANDRAPGWLPGGDTLFYSAETLGLDRTAPRVPGRVLPPFPQPVGMPAGEGFLMAMHPAHGVAAPFLPGMHDRDGDPTSIVLAADVTPDGKRIAYLVAEFNQPNDSACTARFVNKPTFPPTPVVGGLSLFVRDRNDATPHEEDTGVHVALDGVQLVTDPPGDEDVDHYVFRYRAFHDAVRRDDLYPFRPSWSPAGDQLVFSDGEGLRLWNPDEDGETPGTISGTEGGVSPAWSPTGEWIAYTALTEGQPMGPSEYRLYSLTPTGPVLSCVTEHWHYPLTGRRLLLTKPDGSASVDLGDGMDPAWSANGQTLYFVRDRKIWARNMATGTERQVPDTERGRQPAPSPGGGMLAFVRDEPESVFYGYNIWIRRLPR